MSLINPYAVNLRYDDIDDVELLTPQELCDVVETLIEWAGACMIISISTDSDGNAGGK